MIVIIDYNCGNVGSILNMLKKIGMSDVVVSSDSDEIARASKIILPGVGNFDAGINNLRGLGLEETLTHKVTIEKTPILGICMGMQLFMERSEEGVESGLGWIKGEVVRFVTKPDQKIKVPHMGWNTVEVSGDSLLLSQQPEEFGFYFVHSYYVSCADSADVSGWSWHGQMFACCVERENIYGVQFHPEKSHKYGMQLMKSFVELS